MATIVIGGGWDQSYYLYFKSNLKRINMSVSIENDVKQIMSFINDIVEVLNENAYDLDTVEALEEYLKELRDTLESKHKSYYITIYTRSNGSCYYRILPGRILYREAWNFSKDISEDETFDIEDVKTIEVSEETYTLFQRYKYIYDAYMSLTFLQKRWGDNYISEGLLSELKRLRDILHISPRDSVGYN